MLGKPFSHVGDHPFPGPAFDYIPKEPTGSLGPCYRCVFQNPPPPTQCPPAGRWGFSALWAGS
jgi:molybdopterin/thiamine biosynthesis adenylyltransferase